MKTRREFFRTLGQVALGIAALPVAALARRDPMDGKITFFQGFRHIRFRPNDDPPWQSIYDRRLALEKQWQKAADGSLGRRYGRGPQDAYLEGAKLASKHIVKMLKKMDETRWFSLKP